MQAKRAGRALVVFIVLGTVFSGVVGLAAAAEENVFVPEARRGDSGFYVVRQVVDDEDLARGDVPFDWARITWQEERSIVDETGVPQYVRPAVLELMFREHTQYESLRMQETYYDPASGDALQERFFSSGEHGAYGGFQGFGRVDAGHYENSVSVAWGPKGPCGISTPLHGAIAAPARMEVPGNCRDFRHIGADPTTSYRRVGEGVWRDRATVIYEMVEHPEYRLVYADGISLPVQIEVSLADHIAESYTIGRHYSLELDSFARGSEPFPLRGPRMVNDPLPRVDRVGPTHLDESGMTGFTLEKAYEVIHADTESPRLADVMAQPGAYLAAAWKNNLRDDDGRTIVVWTLAATNGHTGVVKRVQESPNEYMLPEPVRGLGESSGASDASGMRYFVSTLDMPMDWLGDAPVGKIPARIPDLNAAMERSTAYDRIDEPNVWGFFIACRDSACNDVMFGLRTGQETLPSGTFAMGTEGTARSEQTTAFFDQTGLLSHIFTHQSDGGTEPLVPVSNNEGGAAPIARPQESNAVWVRPDATAAASLGILALIGSLLYYFWPTVKIGFIGMFSRIRDDKVLDQPQRRAINDAIAAEPGIHFKELERRTGIGRGALEHHLRKLHTAGTIVRQDGTGYTCFFPNGAMDHDLMRMAPQLRSAGTQRILQAIAQRPGAKSGELVATVGLSGGTVSYHIGKLRKLGLLEDGRALRLTPLGQNAMSMLAS